MRFALKDTATAIAVDLPERPDYAASFVVVGPSGGETQAETVADVSAVDTTLASAAAAGATSVTVDSAAGLTAGRKYLLGGSESTGGERVTVKSVSGTTVTLARPLRTAKLINARFCSTRVECVLTAAAVPSYGRHYRVTISWSVSSADQPPVEVPFDVCRYLPVTHLSLDDVTDLDPVLLKRLPAGLWPPALIERAFDQLCRRIAAKKEPGALIGAIDLTTPHGYLFRALLAETAGPDFEEYRKLMVARYGETLDEVLASAAFDDDQDGAAEDHERWYRGIDVMRG
jgi:hypothetical protein